MKVINEKVVPDLKANKNVIVKVLDEYPAYGISNDGRIWSFYFNKWLKQWDTHNNYLRVYILNKEHIQKKVRVHRLVGYAWVFNDDPLTKDTIDHIDFNRHNNKADNLQWLSRSNNSKRRQNMKNEV